MQKTRAPRSMTAMLVAAMLLAGCGFHLRGAGELPPALARVHIESADRDLAARLTAALRARGAVIVGAGQGATIAVVGDFAQSTLATDSQGVAIAYAMRYRVSFTVSAAGAPRSTEQTFALNRAFDYDRAKHLQAEAEEAFARDALRREAVERIVRRLLAL